MATHKELRLEVENGGQVSALLTRPENARHFLVLSHGAGAGMNHPFMKALSEQLCEVGMATLRYQFPYMEERRKIPDPPKLLIATVVAAVRAGLKAAAGLPLLAGGKSMGGRMTSQAAAASPLEGVAGLVFFGFPLHPPNRPGTKRSDHLARVNAPMLFLQGTRDTFADLNLLSPVCKELGSRATLHIIEGADHSFHVPKRSGKTDADVLHELAATTSRWATEIEKNE